MWVICGESVVCLRERCGTGDGHHLLSEQIYGMADRYGTLEVGKVANVVVWDGDPLEMLTDVEHVFIRGQEVPLVSRETMLRDRYMNLDENARSYRRP